jgi:hypothetical protein
VLSFCVLKSDKSISYIIFLHKTTSTLRSIYYQPLNCLRYFMRESCTHSRLSSDSRSVTWHMTWRPWLHIPLQTVIKHYHSSSPQQHCYFLVPQITFLHAQLCCEVRLSGTMPLVRFFKRRACNRDGPDHNSRLSRQIQRPSPLKVPALAFVFQSSQQFYSQVHWQLSNYVTGVRTLSTVSEDGCPTSVCI